MRKRRLKLVALMVCAPFLFLAACLLLEHLRGRISLERYRRELLAKGEKLSPRDFLSGRPLGENGAPEVMAAVKELQERTVLPKHWPPRMRLTPAGRAIMGFDEDEWVDVQITNHWEQLAADLGTNEAILARIRQALGKPVLDSQMDLSRAPHLEFANLGVPKLLTAWFGSASELALHEGRTHEALESLVSDLRVADVLGNDPVAISALVRMAIASIARADTWEALQAGPWADADLARLQDAWEAQHFASGVVHALEGEAVFGLVSCETIRKSNTEAAGMLYGMEDLVGESEAPLWERIVGKLPGGEALAGFCKKQIYCRVWRFAWLDQDERRSLQQMEALLRIVRAGATGKSLVALRPALEQLFEAASKRGPYDRLRFPEPLSIVSLSRVPVKAMQAETERSLALCAIALKRYALAHGGFPAALADLMPGILKSVPIDYMDGQPIRYRPNNDGSFRLYSVGEDGRDDGGDASLLPGKTAFRNLWNRKDVVWPAPALPVEVQEYRQHADQQ